MQGHRAKEQRFCIWLCMDTAPFIPQFLSGKLAVLDVGGLTTSLNSKQGLCQSTLRLYDKGASLGTAAPHRHLRVIAPEADIG